MLTSNRGWKTIASFLATTSFALLLTSVALSLATGIATGSVFEAALPLGVALAMYGAGFAAAALLRAYAAGNVDSRTWRSVRNGLAATCLGFMLYAIGAVNTAPTVGAQVAAVTSYLAVLTHLLSTITRAAMQKA